MSFSGEFRTKQRKVDLRGKSKSADRTALLEQARKEREQRQRFRVETRAATRIQAPHAATPHSTCHTRHSLILEQNFTCGNASNATCGTVASNEGTQARRGLG